MKTASLPDEGALIRAALDLGAGSVGGKLSSAEGRLIRKADQRCLSGRAITAMRRAIKVGQDPLGDAFCELRPGDVRRTDGAVYTPNQIVEPMVEWIERQAPVRVVDAGSGSGRFAASVLRRDPRIPLVAVDLDPLATLMTRAVAAVLDAPNVTIKQADYTRLRLPQVDGATAFIGNPPYVRHHQLTPEAKAWARQLAARMGHKVSGLAGLHAHFFLATAALAKPGDVGCFVTSAEWLDVNYGAIMRSLALDELGVESLHVVEPKAQPFEGTATTAVITTFRIGSQPPTIRMAEVDRLEELSDLGVAGVEVARPRLQESARWSTLLRSSHRVPDGYIELGELCRVHRGTVTGANAMWVRQHGADLPDSVLFHSVTKARELFAARTVLMSSENLKVVIDIPHDLDEIDGEDRKAVDRFLRMAKKAGVDKGYIAAHRRAWWSVGLKEPAPILATYMARQPPAFVLNAVEARHINVAHGLYPREHLDSHVLTRLAEALRVGTRMSQGRVYAGGLTKFEPKEMERLTVPDLATLRGHEPLAPSVDA